MIKLSYDVAQAVDEIILYDPRDLIEQYANYFYNQHMTTYGKRYNEKLSASFHVLFENGMGISDFVDVISDGYELDTNYPTEVSKMIANYIANLVHADSDGVEIKTILENMVVEHKDIVLKFYLD